MSLGNIAKNLSKKLATFKKPLKVKAKKKKITTIFAIVLGVFILVFAIFKFLIAATVNNVPITRFEVIKLLEREGGQQALDNLITRQLVIQEARKKKLTVSQEEIDAKLNELNSYLEQQGTTLDDALALQSQTKEDLIEDIKIQALVEKLLSEELNVSDEEVQKYFEDNRDFFAKDAKFADVSGQINSQLKSDKLSQKFQEWLDTVRSESSIRRFLSY